MSSDVHELLRVSNVTVRRVLSRELRKAMGLYYLLWGTYPIAIAALYTISYEFSVIDSALSFRVFSLPMMFIIMMAIAMIYAFLSRRFFSMAYRVSRSPIIVNRRGRYWLRWVITSIIMVTTIAVYPILVGLGNVYNAYIEYIPAVVYATLVAFTNATFFKSGFIRARYYDYLANASFIILFPLSLIYYFGYYILSLIWIYAGARSLLEVISGG
ncbi:MAG: hypothetical protein RXN91_07945 [Caldivirga sp.]